MEEKDDFWGQVESAHDDAIPSVMISGETTSPQSSIQGKPQSITGGQSNLIIMQQPSQAPKIVGVLVIIWGGFIVLSTLASPVLNDFFNSLLPEEDQVDLTMDSVDYILGFISIVMGFGYVYAGNLMTKHQRSGIHLAFGLIVISTIIAISTLLLEPVPSTQKEAAGLYYGLGIGIQLFCSTMCFLIAALPLMVGNSQFEPVKLENTGHLQWNDELLQN